MNVFLNKHVIRFHVYTTMVRAKCIVSASVVLLWICNVGDDFDSLHRNKLAQPFNDLE